jgi:hypothetical protein
MSATYLLFLASAALAAPAPADDVRVLATGLKPYGDVAPSGFSQALKLSGSRGEILGFTLRARPGSGCVEPSLELEGIGADIRFGELLSFTTSKPSYRGAPVGTHWDPIVPRRRFCAPAGGELWIHGELEIPATAKRGTYAGKLRAGGAELPVELRVWRMRMPERPAVPLYSELTTWFLLLGHYGKWHDGEAELGRRYIERMLAHRIVPLKHWVRLPDLKGGAIDLRRVGGAASRDAFASTVALTLPEWAYLSAPIPQPPKAGPAAEAYFGALQSALKTEGWLERSFFYLWDEPRKGDLPALTRLAESAKRAAPGVRRLVTTTWKPELEDLVDIFVPVMDQFDRKGFAPVSAYEARRGKPGKETWLYASCMSHGCGNDVDSGSPDWVIDRPGAWIRSQGWIAMRYGVEALLYYSVNNFYPGFAKGRDPWRDLYDFSGNGDGTLFYPGRPGMHGLTEHGPVDSLRLKLWRQSSYDAEYVKWMNESGTQLAGWPAQLGSLVRSVRDWEKSETAYQTLRDQIGDFLDKSNSSKK